MNIFLTFTFLFFLGSTCGWGIEAVFRRFFSSANPERKWINPGFCVGPYVPLYGFGLCLLYLIASWETKLPFANPAVGKGVLFLLMAVCMTAIEYVAGILCVKIMKVRLWDYSGQWGNIQGIICPKFSLAWAALGAVYYFCVHPYILGALEWLSQNLAFSFVVGFFFGVFVIDVVYSANLVVKVKKFAEENHVVVRYERLKADIRSWQEHRAKKYHFFFALRSDRPIAEHLKDMYATLERHIRKKEN